MRNTPTTWFLHSCIDLSQNVVSAEPPDFARKSLRFDFLATCTILRMGRVEYITDTMATTIVTHNAPRIQEENRRRPDSSGGTVLSNTNVKPKMLEYASERITSSF